MAESVGKWLMVGVVCGLALGAGGVSAQAPKADAMTTLRQGFLHPPDAARPIVRWWWFGVAVTKPEILRELEQMKADGIGGAELAFVYPQVVDDPAQGLKNLPFLSPEMLDAMHYAQAEGRRLGLRIDVTLCSGWPYGGPHTTLAEAAGRLRVAEVPVAAGVASTVIPKLAEGDAVVSAELMDVREGVAAADTGRYAREAHPETWKVGTAIDVPVEMAILSRSRTGSVTFVASEKKRVAVFFISSHTRQQVKRAAVGAEGFVLDPFSHAAVATYLKDVGEPLVKTFGNTPPYAIFSDSLEAYGADWTPELPKEFSKRRGYDLIPHLAELVAGGTPEAEKLRHDWGKTLTELVNENYLTQINNWAIAHHSKFRSQTYGEPAVSFSSQVLAGLPEGEGPQWRTFSTLRWATSANHVYGNDVTSGETFTWLHSPVFRAIPLDMKAEADIDFIMGENQLVFHGWPYSAPQVGEPGWSLYAAAVFNDHNPWHPVMPAVTEYITRLSWLLRQGKPANQVTVLLPTDDAWAAFAPGKVSVSEAMQTLVPKEILAAILSAGYNVDFIDADAINRVGLGTHEVLVLPPTDRIPVETLRKIDAWVTAGGKAIGVGRLPSMDAEGKVLGDVGLTKEIALVPGVAEISQALHDAAKPDLVVTKTSEDDRNAIGFIRRRLPDADIYYVVNTSNRPVDAGIFFATRFKKGERWNPETGLKVEDSIPADLSPVGLAPYESALYVFSDEPTSARQACDCNGKTIDLSADWQVTFPGIHKREKESVLSDWTADAATQHYSGEGDYVKDFELKAKPASRVWLEVDGGTPLPGSPNSPPEHEALGKDGLPNPLITRPGPGMHAYYDPPVRAAALVFISGKAAGALWHPPYRLDVTKLLKAGTNHIEIRVYNTALNAWSALPPHDYGPLIAKYGDRFQMQDMNKVRPIPSGILGSIHLVTKVAQ